MHIYLSTPSYLPWQHLGDMYDGALPTPFLFSAQFHICSHSLHHRPTPPWQHLGVMYDGALLTPFLFSAKFHVPMLTHPAL
jgi:hypothetical protein